MSTRERKARAIVERTGVVPGPQSPLLEVSGRACRSEDAESELCDSLILQLTGRSGVVNLSQKRESQLTIGLSDRRYRAHGYAFFYEIKAEDGKLTASQHAFLLDELQHCALAGVGTLEDLRALLDVLRLNYGGRNTTGEPFTHCQALIARWAGKGYRREPPRRHRRKR